MQSADLKSPFLYMLVNYQHSSQLNYSNIIIILSEVKACLDCLRSTRTIMQCSIHGTHV